MYVLGSCSEPINEAGKNDWEKLLGQLALRPLKLAIYTKTSLLAWRPDVTCQRPSINKKSATPKQRILVHLYNGRAPEGMSNKSKNTKQCYPTRASVTRVAWCGHFLYLWLNPTAPTTIVSARSWCSHTGGSTCHHTHHYSDSSSGRSQG